jgi:hypothetical protein
MAGGSCCPRTTVQSEFGESKRGRPWPSPLLVYHGLNCRRESGRTGLRLQAGLCVQQRREVFCQLPLARENSVVDIYKLQRGRSTGRCALGVTVAEIAWLSREPAAADMKDLEGTGEQATAARRASRLVDVDQTILLIAGQHLTRADGDAGCFSALGAKDRKEMVTSLGAEYADGRHLPVAHVVAPGRAYRNARTAAGAFVGVDKDGLLRHILRRLLLFYHGFSASILLPFPGD